MEATVREHQAFYKYSFFDVPFVDALYLLRIGLWAGLLVAQLQRQMNAEACDAICYHL